jgi:hypothetical protein
MSGQADPGTIPMAHGNPTTWAKIPKKGLVKNFTFSNITASLTGIPRKFLDFIRDCAWA